MRHSPAPRSVTIPVTFELSPHNSLMGFAEQWATLTVSNDAGRQVAEWTIHQTLNGRLVLQTTLPHPDGRTFDGSGGRYSASMFQVVKTLASMLVAPPPGEAGEHVHPEPVESAHV